jgi:hypothetical protein
LSAVGALLFPLEDLSPNFVVRADLKQVNAARGALAGGQYQTANGFV